MRYIANHSLHGKQHRFHPSLHGKSTLCDNNSLPLDLLFYRNLLFNRFIIPAYQRKYTTVINNDYILPRLYKVFSSFSLKYKGSFDVDIYLNIVILVEVIIDKIQLNNSLKKLVYGDGNMGSLVFELSRLRLLAEHDIYNNIFGKPDVAYNEDIINRISDLLTNDNNSFEDIENIIKNEFP